MSELNVDQQQAVRASDGPVLIVAGPGTGKTKTLTERIVFLLEQGVSAQNILALTFTNKAAREMRERLAARFNTSNLPKVTTFHALGFELLSQGDTITLISEAERTQLIRELPRPAALKGISVRELGLMLSRAKTASVTSEQNDDFQMLLDTYEHTLAEQGLHDFDDLLYKTHRLLAEQPDKRPNYTYLLVDEFQDTSELQYELLRQLNTTNNLFVIGDPNQSIYSFRGVEAEMFDRFRHDFPDALEITLGINYRSVPEVVQLSNAVFPDTPPLQPHSSQSGHVQAMQVLNEYSEATYILDTIERNIGGSSFLTAQNEQGGARLSDFAVLYRTHRAATIIRDRFRQSGIPYQVAGEDSPYQRPEVQTIITLLRQVAGQPAQPSKLLSAYSSTQLKHILDNLPKACSVSELANSIAKIFEWDKGNKQAGQDIQQCIGSLVRFGHDLPAALQHLDSIAESEFYDPSVDAVTLLTIHAAKGLEFDHVFLCAAEEDILPHRRKSAPTNLEEERRLFYVAVTRAHRHLDILHTRTRGGQAATVSAFVSSIPTDILPRHTDPALADQQRRLKKRAQKRSQASLF